MGVAVFTSIADKNLPDSTEAKIMITDEVMY